MASKLFAGFERQRYDRVKRECPVVVRVPSAEPDGRDHCIHGETLNFSAGGMLCVLHEPLLKGAVVTVEIAVPNWGQYVLACSKKIHKIMGRPFRATGRVMRVVERSATSSYVIAMHFIHVDPDSRCAMRKYVTSNV